MSTPNPILGGGGFHHVAIKTRDWDRTMKFYQETLGFRPKIAWNAAPKRAIMLDVGDGNYLEVFEDPAYTPAANGAIVHLALRTTRLDAVMEAVRATGAKVTMEPKDVAIPVTNGGGPVPARLAFFEGPSGEVVELFQNSLT
jgi:catechol 2,3-dioxygenase-like lactoylglutathione lyase family enzyme